MKKIKLVTFLMLLFSVGLYAQKNYWRPVAAARNNAPVLQSKLNLTRPKLFELDINGLKTELAGAPKRNGRVSSNIIITFPDADGKYENFRVIESSNMDPVLAAKYPNIKSYVGKGIEDPTEIIYFSVSPAGLQTMLIRPGKPVALIEPYTNDKATYAAYNKGDKANSLTPWECRVIDAAKKNLHLKGGQNRPNADDGNLRTYRLALSVTGEYSTYFGGTKALALAGMNATITRINGIFETDFGVHLNLIANDDILIYLDAATDPYSDGDAGAAGAWNQEIQDNLTSVIGNANYDIGHLFGATGGGGNAGCIACVCKDDPGISGEDAKGRGFTSPNTDSPPVGDDFDLDFVAHEMGHQFGANHTWSFQAEAGTPTLVEPGSGTTIMSYAGVTGIYDVQPHNSAYFHGVSIAQVTDYIKTTTCQVTTVTGNTAPAASAGPDFIIPHGTPFALTGVGSDVNGDALTYCWEQTDRENEGTPFPSTTSTDGPAFRSFDPKASPVRYFPALETVLSGLTATQWEAVPDVARIMGFRLTVRDNHAGGPANNSDDVIITTDAASGPFIVTSPNTAVTLPGGSAQTITWNVANTTAPPVSAANVKISLSTDGGFTFSTVLSASTPNDGSQLITLPNITTTTARIKVEAVGNIFFDISNVNFSINSVATSFNITATAGANGSILPAGVVSVTSGANQTFNIAANPCYKIATVLIDGVNNTVAVSNGTYTFTNVTAAHTISATFTQISYTITSSAGANGSITPNGPTAVNCGANQSYTITPNILYKVQDVLVDGLSVGAVTNYTFTNVTTVHTITTSFALIAGTFTITSGAGTGGTITPTGAVAVTSGTNQTFNIAANSCYAISDVVVDGVSKGPIATYTFSTVLANHSINASFSQLSYNIAVSAGANGNITPATGSAICGSNRTYTITANTCYQVAGVIVDGVPQGAITTYTFTNVTAAHTISATFSKISYTITSGAGANGSITPNGSTAVSCGANQTYTITSAGGFVVQNVIVDGVSQGGLGTYTFTNVTANHTISATFVVGATCTPPVLSAVIMAVSCKSGNTGAINLTTTGGTGPFAYSWTGPGGFSKTTEDISALIAGTYTVKVKANGGCISTASYIINEPAASLTVSAVPGVINCNGNKTTVVVTASGGTAPYTGTGTIANQSAGSHTYTITDSKGCSVVKTIDISQPSAINVTATVGTIPCAGGTTTVTLSAAGGTSPYTGTGTKTNQSAGVHSYTITDAKGCSVVKTINIAEGATTPATPYIFGPSYNLCGGGTFVFFVFPPRYATNYSWTVPAGFSIISGQGTCIVKIKVPSNFTTQGEIKVSASNACGTSPQRSLTVYAVAGDLSSGLIGPASVTAGKTNVKYSLLSCSGFTYTWIVPTGAVITAGQGTATITVKFGSASGYVKVLVKNSCGSSPQAMKYVSVTAASSKAAETDASKDYTKSYLQLNPNPVASTATVIFGSLKMDNKYEIRILDITGKIMFTKSGLTIAGKNTLQVDMGKYAHGIYLVTLINGDVTQTLKMVKAK